MGTEMRRMYNIQHGYGVKHRRSILDIGLKTNCNHMDCT
jgi:hypothetical protein